MAQLAGENLAIKSYQSTIQGLEMDKKNLQKQMAQMEASLKEVTNANVMASLSDQGQLQQDTWPFRSALKDNHVVWPNVEFTMTWKISPIWLARSQIRVTFDISIKMIEVISTAIGVALGSRSMTLPSCEPCYKEMKGSVQQCVKSEIDVLRNGALNVFRLVIYIRIGKWPMDRIIMIASSI